MIERGFLLLIHSCTFIPTLSLKRLKYRCFNGLIPLKKLSPFMSAHFLSVTLKSRRHLLSYGFPPSRFSPLMALFREHLPSQNSPFAVRGSLLTKRICVCHRVSLPRGWLSPITGADLPDVFDLLIPQPFKKVRCTRTIFSSRGHKILDEPCT